MSIPADHITFLPDGTAWLALGVIAVALVGTRPCDCACHRIGVGQMDCACIDGRHTFDIEVGDWNQADHTIASYCEVVKTYRVSVVPGMVLPIGGPEILMERFDCIVIQEGVAWLHTIDAHGNATHRQITLPPAAAPGMFAVKLQWRRDETPT